MSPSPSFAPFKKFQIILLFASLTIVYLVYSIGTGRYSTAIESDDGLPKIPSFSNPLGHDATIDDESESIPGTDIDPTAEDSLAAATTTSPPAAASSGDSTTSTTIVVQTSSPDAEDEPSTTPNPDEYVAFCVAHRNQRRDLPEFLNHHYHHHGVRRFYIMDDRSDIPLSSFNDYGIPRSALSFQYYDENAQHPDMQTHIYSECARLYGPHHTWMAFIDADEFFETRGNDTLISLLREFEEYEEVGALGVNWRLHSSANLTERPDSMRKSFTSCVEDPEMLPVEDLPHYKDNRLIKSIVKTSVFEKPLTPHLFQTSSGTYTVGEYGDMIDEGEGIRQPITRDRIALHHYTTKSREQFEEKMESWTMKGWEYWDHIEGLPQVPCDEMTNYSP
ncbi:Glycosyltransferase family [Hyphodiscus hymeniophilus]|uniref:Glycosyltransferase family n=1 Tax=Hyphodiscus hymeniophilus TaxID=353542 RepID=A0A9P7AU36_9HELO|nr:Glycosyltransferase family [Hyphodiscus hymeniophilus]